MDACQPKLPYFAPFTFGTFKPAKFHPKLLKRLEMKEEAQRELRKLFRKPDDVAVKMFNELTGADVSLEAYKMYLTMKELDTMYQHRTALTLADVAEKAEEVFEEKQEEFTEPVNEKMTELEQKVDGINAYLQRDPEEEEEEEVETPEKKEKRQQADRLVSRVSALEAKVTKLLLLQNKLDMYMMHTNVLMANEKERREEQKQRREKAKALGLKPGAKPKYQTEEERKQAQRESKNRCAKKKRAREAEERALEEEAAKRAKGEPPVNAPGLGLGQ